MATVRETPLKTWHVQVGALNSSVQSKTFELKV